MLIDFKTSLKKYPVSASGAIVVGAHTAEEHDVYTELGIHDIVYIEPCEKAFSILHDRFWKQADRIILIKAACADYTGKTTMHVETANTGMSNSILEPKQHLDYYPNIQFTDTEEVDVIRLDDLDISRERYNILIMDCQGAEGLILKGATELLKGIDLIYTEVNTAELYKGCMLLPEMDLLLSDFVRVETKMTNAKWGDCIYLRQSILT